MRIAVVGATGRTGRPVTAVLRGRGHEVVAVVRSRARAADLAADALAEADGTDVAGLTTALAGVDAVVWVVGPVKGESVTVMRDSIAAVLAAAAAAGVRRLVAVTATGWVIDGDDPISRWIAKPILGRVIPQVNADFAATESRIRASDRDWTVVRPPRLTTGPARGRYRSRRDGNVRWGYSIRRADLAAAVADALEDPSTIGGTLSVAS